MHISVMGEVIACASRLHPGRSFGGLHSDGVDLSFRLFQRSAPPAAPRVWRRSGRLPLIICSGPLVVEVRKQRKSSYRSSLSRWPLSSFFRLQVANKDVDGVGSGSDLPLLGVPGALSIRGGQSLAKSTQWKHSLIGSAATPDSLYCGPLGRRASLGASTNTEALNSCFVYKGSGFEKFGLECPRWKLSNPRKLCSGVASVRLLPVGCC